MMKEYSQPPSGGCVLKLAKGTVSKGLTTQPPSGGCVLKPTGTGKSVIIAEAAAFGRLCVETLMTLLKLKFGAGSRLRAAVC